MKKISTAKLKRLIREELEAFDLTAKITLPVSGGGAAYSPGRASREFILTRKPYKYGAELIKKPGNPMPPEAQDLLDEFLRQRPSFPGVNPDEYFLYFKDSLEVYE